MIISLPVILNRIQRSSLGDSVFILNPHDIECGDNNRILFFHCSPCQNLAIWSAASHGTGIRPHAGAGLGP